MKLKLLFTLLFATFFSCCGIASLVPSTGPVDTTKITQEEMHVISEFEDGKLKTNQINASEIDYPLPHLAQDCTDRQCENGCTIGYGYNFGAHPAPQILYDFRQAGISEEKINAFLPLSELTGIQALEKCGENAKKAAHENPLSPAPAYLHTTLNKVEAFALMEVKAWEHKQNVIHRADKEGVLCWLSAGQFAVLVALDYQNPSLSSKAHHLWKQLKKGDIVAVLDNIRNHMGTQGNRAPELQMRRNFEADYFAWASNKKLAAQEKKSTHQCQVS